MQVKALLDVDMVALEATDKVTLMLDLTAPQNPMHATRPGQAVQVVLDRSGSMDGAPLDLASSHSMTAHLSSHQCAQWPITTCHHFAKLFAKCRPADLPTLALAI